MSITIYEKKGRVAYIILNRPEVLNAMNNQVKRELNEIFVDFRDDPEIWVGIVSGVGGRAFSTGSDVKEINEWLGLAHRSLAEPELLQTGQIEIWKPLIAAIDGWCVGGGLELALACDIRVATEHSQFGLMEPKLGWPAGAGGTIRLPNQIPFAVAMEMILTADTIDSRRAYEIGLINQVVPSSEEIMPAAERMAERVLACAPLAVRRSKEQALRGFSVSSAVGLPLREIGLADIWASHDTKEGAKAFVGKRKPEWTGK